MADTTKEVVIEVLVENVTQAEKQLDRIRQAIVNTDKADKRRIQTLKTEEQAALKAYKTQVTELKKVEMQMQKTRQATGYLGTSIAYLASDMGFLAQNPRMGLLAIGNNLSQVAIGMQHAAKQAGSMGKALKVAFATQGWMIALQLAISLFTQLPVLLKRSKEGAEDFSASITKNIVNLKLLSMRLKDVNLSLEERNNIMRQLDQKGVNVKGPDGKFLENSVAIEASIKRQIHLLLQRQKLDKLMQEIAKLENEKVEGDWFDRNIGFVADAANWLQVNLLGMEDLGGVEGHIERSKGEVQKKIDKLYKAAEEIIKDINSKGPAGGGGKIKTELGSGLEDQVAIFGLTNTEKFQYLREKAISNLTDMRDKLLEQENITSTDRLKIQENYQKAVEAVNQHYNNLQWEEEIRSFEALEGLETTQAQNRIQREEQANAAILSAKQQFFGAMTQLYTAFGGKSKAIQAALIAVQGAFEIGTLIAKTKAGQAAAKAQTLAANQMAIAQGAALAIPTAGASTAAAAGIVAANTSALAANVAAMEVAQNWGIAAIAASTLAKGAGLFGGSSSAGAGGAGGGRPKFNIVGSTESNQLQSSLENQTREIQETNKNNTVVLVESELETRQSEKKVAVEQSSIG